MAKKITWLIAHQPVELLLRVAKDFEKEVKKHTDEFEFEILTEQEYADYYNNGELVDSLELITQGKVQISQTYVYKLSYWNKNFEVLDMPYLFDTHEHAKRVLDGPIGHSMLKGLENNKKPMKGLAFTYSGGYRIFVSKEQLNSIDDLKGMPVKTSWNPIAIDTIKAMGAEPLALEADDFRDLLFKDAIVAAESTYPRYTAYIYKHATSVLDGGHSLFLTTLVSNLEFWNSLTDEQREIMETAARNAAEYERDKSVEDAEKFRAEAKENGVDIHQLSEDELAKLKAMTAPVYDKWEGHFLPGLVDAIKKS